MDNKTPPLTSSFNMSSMFHWAMWVAMIGIGLTLLTGVPNAGLGDAILSPFMHMVQGVAHLFSADGMQTISTIWSNTMSGNLMPNYADAMWNDALTGGASHSGAAAAGSHLHTAAASSINHNVWDWFAKLPELERATFIADAKDYGAPLGDYISNWCANTGITFTP